MTLLEVLELLGGIMGFVALFVCVLSLWKLRKPTEAF